MIAEGTRASAAPAAAPTPASAGWKLGMQALVQNRLEDAINELRPFVAQYPDSFEGNNFLGMALARSEQYPLAIVHLQKATTLNPRSARTFYNLGLAHLWSDNRPAARAAFQKTLEIDEGHAQAHQALTKMGPEANDTVPVAVPDTGALGAGAINVPVPSAPPGATPGRPAPTSTVVTVPSTTTVAAPTAGATAGAPALQASKGFKPLPPKGAPSATGVPSATGAVSVSGGPAASSYSSDETFDKPNASDLAKATGLGLVAALACAALFAALTYFTHHVFVYAGAGVGFAIGGAIVFGADGKRGTNLQIVGVLLTILSLYLGGVLSLAFMLTHGDLAEGIPSMSLLPAFGVALVAFPITFATGGFGIAGVLAFGFGLYQGWAVPSAGVTD